MSHEDERERREHMDRYQWPHHVIRLLAERLAQKWPKDATLVEVPPELDILAAFTMIPANVTVRLTLDPEPVSLVAEPSLALDHQLENVATALAEQIAGWRKFYKGPMPRGLFVCERLHRVKDGIAISLYSQDEAGWKAGTPTVIVAVYGEP